MTEREREVEREPDVERWRERDRARNREFDGRVDQSPDLGGEELVDGRAGGTENVSDVTKESRGTWRRVAGVVVAILAALLLALPVVWAVGALALLGGIDSPASWLYAALAFVFGIAAAYWAYTLLAYARVE